VAGRCRLGFRQVTFNPPRPQNGALLWAAFCLFGLGLAIYVLIRYPAGTESWLVGWLLVATVVVGFLAIEGWWVVSQRELTITRDTLEVRRWSDALLARRGRQVNIESIRLVRLVFDSGKKVRIETIGGGAITFWAALWPRAEVERLISEAQLRGIPIEADW
jgi:hypothetical protein